MSPDLDALLCARYPKLFRNRHKPSSPLNWGIAVGDGWFDLVDTACRRLQEAVNAGLTKQPTVLEVKEKFADLVLQVAPVNDVTRPIMGNATRASRSVCSECGQAGVLRSTDGWLSTRCDAHATAGSVVAKREDHFP
jgi:hypothetical protein